ncbi:MAG: tripartite tricarboxylate transporter substrate binding protein [Betaproteobacteria bacterium]|nr:MAG: tripartite tricarboxylate transporter substrate binding protein [Betaproteobacteria bacterium]
MSEAIARDRSSVRCRRPRATWSRWLAALGIATLALFAVAQAQDYPSRPIRVVVPFSPGGAVDGPMRVIAQELSKRLGQQVIVDNKPGAGATIGTDVVAKASPDGYTLLLASQTNAISATLYPKLPYDPIEDFTPISLIGREPGVLVVHPSLPVKTFQEFVAYVKERPGRVDYASSGNGSGQHLFVALLASMTGMKMNHVPYRGSGQATADLLGGQVQLSIPGTAGMVGHIKAGKLRALAVTGAKRSPQLPDVPTVMESGVPGYEAYVWMGLLAPKGTPAPIVDKLFRELTQALATSEVKTYMASAGIEIVGSTPAEFATFFRAEKELWARVIRETGAKID